MSSNKKPVSSKNNVISQQYNDVPLPIKLHLEIDPRYFDGSHPVESKRKVKGQLSNKDAAVAIQKTWRGHRVRSTSNIDNKIANFVHGMVNAYIDEYLYSSEFINSVMSSLSNPMDTAVMMMAEELILEYIKSACTSIARDMFHDVVQAVLRKQKQFISKNDANDPVLYSDAKLKSMYGNLGGFGIVLEQQFAEMIIMDEVNRNVQNIVRELVSTLLLDNMQQMAVTAEYEHFLDAELSLLLPKIYTETVMDMVIEEWLMAELDDILHDDVTQMYTTEHERQVQSSMHNALSDAMASQMLRHIVDHIADNGERASVLLATSSVLCSVALRHTISEQMLDHGVLLSSPPPTIDIKQIYQHIGDLCLDDIAKIVYERSIRDDG